MDASTLPTIIIMLGGIIYVTGMYVYRKVTAGESFNLQQYATTFGYVGILAVAAYFANLAVPDFGSILNGLITNGMPDSTGLLAAATAIIVGILHQTTKTTQTVTTGNVSVTTPVTAPPAPVVVFNPGFDVLPTEVNVKSGVAATITVNTGVVVTSLTIDWLDGSAVQTVPLATSPIGLSATVGHVYTYTNPTMKYPTYAFYPKFTISNGVSSLVFNDVANTKREMCTINVTA